MRSFTYSLLGYRFYATVRQGEKPSSIGQGIPKTTGQDFPKERHSFVGSSSTVTFKDKSNFLNNTTSGILSLLWCLYYIIIYSPYIQILMVYVKSRLSRLGIYILMHFLY